MEALTVTQLVAARIAAKRAEDAAIAERRKIDEQISTLLKDPSKPEGSISHKDNGYKVTVTYKIDRKVDSEALTKEWDKLSADVQAAFNWKADVSVSTLRKLENNDLAAAGRYITSKEATPSIKIEAV
jgi:hypothetical protein